MTNHWKAIAQGPVVRSMVSANHWLNNIKINGLSWYLTLVSDNQAPSNSAQFFTVVLFNFTHYVILENVPILDLALSGVKGLRTM